MKINPLTRPIAIVIFSFGFCALSQELGTDLVSKEFRWRRNRAETILSTNSCTKSGTIAAETIDTLDSLGFAIKQNGMETSVSDSFRARLLAELTVFAQTNKTGSLPVRGESPTTSNWDLLLSIHFCLPRWNGKRFLDQRRTAWNGFELPSIAKADLHIVNRKVKSSTSPDGLDTSYPPVFADEPITAEAWSELIGMGFSLEFEKDHHLWKITGHDSVAARLNGRIEASKRLLVSYRGAVASKDDPKAILIAENLDSLGFDLAVSNGIPLVLSSRRAELLAQIPIPNSGDSISLNEFVDSLPGDTPDVRMIQSILQKLSLSGDDVRFVHGIWITSSRKP